MSGVAARPADADLFATARAEAAGRDAADPLARFRDAFVLQAGTINLDGNSLGSMPRAVVARMERVLGSEWSKGLIRSWGGAGWFALPETVGDRIAPLIGAGAGEVVVGDSTSVNLFKCIAAALALRPERRVLLLQEDNFPTDNYIAQGIADMVPGVSLRAVKSTDAFAGAIDDSVAAIVLSHVHYRTALVEDMAAINRAARAAGALSVWDLSHTTGAVPVDVAGAGCDFAIGCTYKYLNGGPGAPAYCWVSPELIERTRQPLSGWMGHKTPFDFSFDYEPATAIRRFVCGTPQILSLAALDAALELWAEVDLPQLHQKSRDSTEFFIDLVERSCAAFGVTVQSPRDGSRRGSHVAFGYENGLQVMRALAAQGIIGDFRTPDTMRFGVAPLYIGYGDIVRAVAALHDILLTRSWDRAEFRGTTVVT